MLHSQCEVNYAHNKILTNKNIKAFVFVAAIFSLIATTCTPEYLQQESQTHTIQGNKDVTILPSSTPCPEVRYGASEIHSGIFLDQDPLDFPISTCGYQIYVIGEVHGYQQTHEFTLRYLEKLNRTAGIQDFIIEESRAYQAAADDFVMSKTDKLIPELCLRSDILKGVRELNEQRLDQERIHLHLVDIDFDLTAIYAHLEGLQQLNEFVTVDFPDFGAFGDWPLDKKFEWVDSLALKTNDPFIKSELYTIRQSILWAHLGGASTLSESYPSSEQALIREEVITRNILEVMENLRGDPVMALYGAGHTQKKAWGESDLIEGKLARVGPWVYQITNSGYEVFSLFVTVMSGEGRWRGKSVRGGFNLDEIFVDGGYPLSFFIKTDDNLDALYIDLQSASKIDTRIGEIASAGELYDGALLFKKGSPMNDRCQ